MGQVIAGSFAISAHLEARLKQVGPVSHLKDGLDRDKCRDTSSRSLTGACH